MKFNWGTGIALFYIIFATSMVALVIKSTQYDHSLVVEDYYQKDLDYQQHYDKLANSKALAEDVQIQLVVDPNKEVQFSFPKEMEGIDGQLHFMRPSHKGSDFSVNIELDEGNELTLPAAKLLPGLWKVQVDWQVGEKSYFKEQVLVL